MPRLKLPKEQTRLKRLAYVKRWQTENPEKTEQIRKKTYAKNKEKILQKRKEYYRKNGDKEKAYTRKWHQENKERDKAYVFANKQKIRNYIKVWEKTQYHKNPQFKLRRNLANRLNKLFKAKGIRKTSSTLKLTGCDMSFLKTYLESKFLLGMSWENKHLWHIDHIRPCSSFNLLDIEQQKLCFHYTNLQPLWKEDNLKKSDTWIVSL